MICNLDKGVIFFCFMVGGIFTNEIGFSFSVFFFFCIVVVYGFLSYFLLFCNVLFSLIGINIYMQMG